jgi:hypothetical protein
VIIDISNPTSPTEVGNFDTPGSALGVTVDGSLVFVADNYSLEVLQLDPSLGIEEDNEKLIIDNEKLILLQNQPNPFHSSTTIRYIVPSTNPASNIPNHVSLKVYDITGRLVETLVNGRQKPGVYEIRWNSRTGVSPVRSGVYFYQLSTRSGEDVQTKFTKKMILLK